PVPDRARRPPRRDLAAPRRLRARPDRRLQPRPRGDDERPRPCGDRGEERVRPRRPRRQRRPPPPRRERARRPRSRPRHDRARDPASDVRTTFTRPEWLRLAGFGGAVLVLHVLGFGLFAYYSGSNPALAGLGVLAYTFGLRHAFDADHIAA